MIIEPVQWRLKRKGLPLACLLGEDGDVTSAPFGVRTMLGELRRGLATDYASKAARINAQE